MSQMTAITFKLRSAYAQVASFVMSDFGTKSSPYPMVVAVICKRHGSEPQSKTKLLNVPGEAGRKDVRCMRRRRAPAPLTTLKYTDSSTVQPSSIVNTAAPPPTVT